MLKKIIKWILIAIAAFFGLSIFTVIFYKFVPPPVTPIMVLRVFEGWFDGKSVGIDKSWRSFDEISPNIYRAVVSAEDARFMQHEGFDWKAIENARKYNEAHKGERLHGASTISMQTAKNTFLWHGRNYARKGLEAYFTFLIEKIWGKKRILEVYVNIVEWGDGVYGVEAASEKYFNKPASQLSKREAALLASVLPNPRRWAPNAPTRYINSRVGFIQGRMGAVAIPKE
jgi:monofunctional biosynthetic peptidoglycan transglycosylase